MYSDHIFMKSLTKYLKSKLIIVECMYEDSTKLRHVICKSPLEDRNFKICISNVRDIMIMYVNIFMERIEETPTDLITDNSFQFYKQAEIRYGDINNGIELLNEIVYNIIFNVFIDRRVYIE